MRGWFPKGDSGEGQQGLGWRNAAWFRTWRQTPASGQNWSVGLVSGPVGAQAAPGLRIPGPASPVVGRAEAAEAFLPHGSRPKVGAGPEEFLLLVIGQSWSHAPL